jgi:hypothetical protein
LALPSLPRVAARNASDAITKQNRLVPATIKNIARLLLPLAAHHNGFTCVDFCCRKWQTKDGDHARSRKVRPDQARRAARLSEVNTVNRFVDS